MVRRILMFMSSLGPLPTSSLYLGIGLTDGVRSFSVRAAYNDTCKKAVLGVPAGCRRISVLAAQP